MREYGRTEEIAGTEHRTEQRQSLQQRRERVGHSEQETRDHYKAG